MSNLEEVLSEFKKGTKIRKKDWSMSRYLYYSNGKVFDEDNSPYTFSTADLFVEEWYLIKEDHSQEYDWEYIIQNNITCWFWDDDTYEDSKRTGTLLKVAKNGPGEIFPFERSDSSWWQNCRPIMPNEIKPYDKKED